MSYRIVSCREQAYTALALFNMLRFPLIMVPFLLTTLLNALNAVDRLGAFLLQDESDDLERDASEPGRVVVTNGRFAWPKVRLRLLPIRSRSRGEGCFLRTSPGASLRPGSLAFNPRPRRLSTPLLTPLNSTPTRPKVPKKTEAPKFPPGPQGRKMKKAWEAEQKAKKTAEDEARAEAEAKGEEFIVDTDEPEQPPFELGGVDLDLKPGCVLCHTGPHTTALAW